MKFFRQIRSFNQRDRLSSFFVVCLVLGILLVVFTQAQVHWRFSPMKVTLQNATWRIVSYQQKERITFDFLAPDNEKVVFSWSGSTDTLCENPYVLIFDVDSNKYDDVYFHGCRGHGFLPYEQASGQMNFVDLGQIDLQDAPGLTTFWFQELKARGSRLVTIGIIIATMGLCGTIYVELMRSRVRNVP